MKRKLLFILIFIIAFGFNLFIKEVSFDEVWIYGFSYNISKGLIPYLDFNMLQTPFSLFVGSIFIKIFGNYLFSLCILNGLIVTLSIYFLYRIIGYRSLLLFPLFVMYTIFGYNTFCLFFLILILYFVYMDKEKDFIIGLIIGICFITKQTIGICLLVPYLFYSKNRLKSLFSFMIPFLILSIYLVYNNCFYQFMDYCFFGLLDFGNKNSNVGILFFVSCMVVLSLFIILIKGKFKDRGLFYILAFQIMAFPLGDFYHFMMAFLPVLFYIIYRVKYKYIIIFIGILSYNIFIISFVRSVSNFYLVMDNNYLFLKRMDRVSYSNIVSKSKIIDEERNDCYFIISPESYYIKLYLGIDIGKYDFMLNGNMGYHGSEKMIKDISEEVVDKRCLFYVSKGII